MLDDNIANVVAARETGARVVHVTSQPDAGNEVPTITMLANLPAIIEAL